MVTVQRSTIYSVTLPDAVTSMSTTLFIILFRIPSGRQLLPLLLWRVVEAGKPPLPEVPEVPEEDVEAVPPLGVVPPAPPSAEDGPPTEEPPPGEERPERHGETPTAPPTPREEPPPGEERPGGR